jgi:hypothetical protein
MEKCLYKKIKVDNKAGAIKAKVIQLGSKYKVMIHD